MCNKSEMVDKLTGYIIGVYATVNVSIQNKTPVEIKQEEVIGNLRVFTFIRVALEGQVEIIFQLGTDHIQTDIDNYIALNTITVSFGTQGEKLLNSRTYGRLVTMEPPERF